MILAGRRLPCALVAVAALVVAASGCTCDGSVGPDGSVGDGAALADGGPADSGPPVDGGMCEPFGSTRLCRPWCGLPCPTETVCNTSWDLCSRASDECGINLRAGVPYDCHEGRTCLSSERSRPSEHSWDGICVAPEYCRWLLANPDERPDERCRYSEGTLFEDGPPDHACAPGGYEFAPFCGGACGDACPAYTSDNGGCVGVSETRGFGVCVPEGYSRCDPADLGRTERALSACSWQIFSAAPGEELDTSCACMVLSPSAMAEYAQNGWAVSLRTCLAYRERYPDEVQCYDESWDPL